MGRSVVMFLTGSVLAGCVSFAPVREPPVEEPPVESSSQVCVPETARCLADGTRSVCSTDGLTESASPCPDTTPICVDGTCVACVVGQKRCNLNVVEECASTQSFHASAPCGYRCVGGACVPAPPSVTQASFVAYERLRVTFSEDPGVTALNPAAYVLAPVRPLGLAVSSVSAVGGAVYELVLTRYHLPLVYTVSAPGVADVRGNAVTGSATAAGTQSRVVFLTSVDGKGNLADTADWPENGGLAGVAAGDRICQTAADRAGLQGTFTAFLSATGNDAFCRLAGLPGLRASNCGLASEPTDAGPWVTLAGVPFSSSLSALGAGSTLVPVGFDETGARPAGNLYAMTGSLLDGTLGNACADWSSAAVSQTGYMHASVQEQLLHTNVDGASPCNNDFRLLCVQTGGAGLGLGTAYEHPGKRVFVSSTGRSGNYGGIGGADVVCQQLADASLPSPGTFVAWLSNRVDDAYCRVLGFGGKMSANCGQASLPTGGGPWVRLDGLLVASSVTDLLDDIIAAPIAFTETGGRASNASARTGTGTGGAGGIEDCEQYTSTSATVRSGRNDNTSGKWTDNGASSCALPQRLYCFEL